MTDKDCIECDEKIKFREPRTWARFGYRHVKCKKLINVLKEIGK